MWKLLDLGLLNINKNNLLFICAYIIQSFGIDAQEPDNDCRVGLRAFKIEIHSLGRTNSDKQLKYYVEYDQSGKKIREFPFGKNLEILFFYTDQKLSKCEEFIKGKSFKKTIYKYNENGLLLTEIEYRNDSLYSKTDFNYSADNLIINKKEYFYDYDKSPNKKIFTDKSFSYYENGVLKKIKEEWEDQVIFTNYNESGNEISAYIYDREGKLILYNLYEYNSLGKLRRSIRNDLVDGFKSSSILLYSMDSTNFKTTVCFIGDREKDTVLIEQKRYNRSGFLLEECYYNFKSGLLEKKLEYKYLNNSLTKKVEYIYEYNITTPDNNKPISTLSKTVWRYDKKSGLVLFKYNDQEQISYFYNNKGCIVKELVSSPHTNDTVIIYEYQFYD